MSFLKVVLKRIFPIPLLKRVFLIYNTFKIKTIDKLIFKELEIPYKDFKIYRKGYPFRTEVISLDDLEGREEYSYLSEWLDWSQEEFLILFSKPCTIEPDGGWALVGKNTLVYESLSLSRTMHLRKPSLRRYWFKKSPQHLDEAISLRDTGEENYFHFYNDVLSKIFFLKENGINIQKVPLIISKKLWDKAYFQYYLNASPLFPTLSWIVQDRQYITCRRTIFCKPLTHRKDLLDIIFFPLRKNIVGEKKIFLTRNKVRLRYLENASQIEEICSNRGFEVIDTDQMTMPQQIDIFSKASLIIGIHGAGLTNMMFSCGQCKILELFPPPDAGYLPFHYVMMAKMQGFRYRAIIGDKPQHRYSGGFRIDIKKFEEALSDLL